MNKTDIRNLDIKNRRVFIRVDFNVPVKDGAVTDATRIVEAIPTIRYAVEAGAKVILASHLGRPKGEKNEKYSLKPVADYVNDHFLPVTFVDNCVGPTVEAAIDKLKPGQVLLLENLRFYSGEEGNDEKFVDQLAKHADVYVNDAFGTSHRKHASVYGLPLKMNEKGLGFLLEKEVDYFTRLIERPEKPFAAVLGGAKVSDKIGVIESLLDKADVIIIGGAMAYTFLKHDGHTIGTSMVEDDMMDTVSRIRKKAKEKQTDILLPVDHVCSREFAGAPEKVDGADIPDGLMGLDIGEKTVKLYTERLGTCKTVLWNGPMGVFEEDAYANGTMAVAKFLAKLKTATVVVGGGDSVAAVGVAGVADSIDHISTGGGASLEYLEFGTLPGIEAL